MEKLNINQCERVAQDLCVVHSGSITPVLFDLCGPRGKKPARWIDPYMGAFQIDGDKGFMITRDVEMIPDLWCENVRLESA